MKHLWTTLCLWSIFVAFAFAARIMMIGRQESRALQILSNDKNIPRKDLRAETYNFLRGDVRVDFAVGGITWTVNTRTGQIFSWQSKNKESSVLQSFLKNFKK